MNLKNLLSVINSGNVSLGNKLADTLSEDCVILEYTNDSVIYLKENRLFKATFDANNLLAENIKPEEIRVSMHDVNKTLNEKLKNVVEGVATEQFTFANEALQEFCELYHQTSVLKAKCPEVFVEGKGPAVNKGTKIRKNAFNKLKEFQSSVFKLAVIDEALEEDFTPLASVLADNGIVLALGEAKLTEALSEALLGNKVLAESVTKSLYSMIEQLGDPNKDLEDLNAEGYDLEAGKFPDESMDDVAGEDLMASDEPEGLPELGEEEPKEFETFDPAMLSEEESRELHKRTLNGILNAIKDFVVEKSNDVNEVDFDPELGDAIQNDIDDLNDPELSDARLSEIEAKWQSMLDFFLDSDTHTPDDMASDFAEEPIDSSIPGVDESEDISDLDATAGVDEISGEEPMPLPEEEPKL